jgi:exodeoxyribonuclease V gamma subunit
MTNLNLYTSNRLEKLAEALAGNVRRPLRSPLAPETVLVQSQGMARWLQLQLARSHGICSNCRFPFPRAFSYEVFRNVLGDLPSAQSFDPELLRWQVMNKIPAFLDQPGFEAVRNYLGNEADDRKLYQLADRIANTFDQYLVFRPELIRQWESGHDQNWQAQLWREVSRPFRDQHPAALQARLIAQLERADGPFAGLPERVAIFGVSALPPFYLHIFAALARHVEVSLYLLQPCKEFWGYISSVREQEKTLKRAGKGAAEAGQLHLERGNRLLASMGQLGRDFLLLLQETGDWHESEPSLFCPPETEPWQNAAIVSPSLRLAGAEGPNGERAGARCASHQSEITGMLSRIQADILRLEDFPAEKQIISASDDSLQVHSCHSPLRELEVLHDHLLDWFARDPQLAPRDILVMIPDIEQYAPYIQAVFGSPEQESLRIPFSVADRTARAQSQLIETFLSLLKLADSRLGASQVLALLESASVRRKFALAEDDLELVRHWVEEVRIRWGRDEQQRAGLGLPAWRENTWRHGMERLLLGYAMAGKDGSLFQNILPCDDIEGNPGEVLGRFAEFVECLFATLDSLKPCRRLDEWAATFRAILNRLFEIGDGEAAEFQAVGLCLEKLAGATQKTGFDRPVGLAVVLEQLNRDLAQDYFGAGYLTGGVTFCALKPMRSIPAKVICLLGMNDRSFPRTSPQLSFDLMAQQPQLGDRSSREDDRYLFLETLISARDRLYISYVGQSIRDNSEAPPSVLVSELLDAVAQRFELPGEKIIAGRVLTKHRLQAFSPAYFQGGRLFSYSRENLKASRSISPARQPQGEFVPKPLPEPEPDWRRMTLESLANFFSNPARFLAEKRLGLRLPDEAAAMDERETFSLAGLDGYKLQQELLELKIRGAGLKDALESVRASGRLPAGVAGEAGFAQLRRNIELFHQRLLSYEPDKILPPESFELAIGDFVVSGNISHATPGGLLFYRAARIKSKDRLRAWVEHLLVQAVRGDDRLAGTILVGADDVLKFNPVSNPLAELKTLLDLYWAGLRQPLKFFPETSHAFAEAGWKLQAGRQGRQTQTPRERALAKWRGNERGSPGEEQDKFISLFFRDETALDEEFETIARTVFQPVLENSTEGAE